MLNTQPRELSILQTNRLETIHYSHGISTSNTLQYISRVGSQQMVARQVISRIQLTQLHWPVRERSEMRQEMGVRGVAALPLFAFPLIIHGGLAKEQQYQL
ncbi:hypothetical protein H0G86_005456 [Trichoderma simmonsii]|uniref:Uncharacterized protein n=1 Tax=Trichoderma simmonsii TaxID=1491479 RepID=A0A8G0LEB4_9HYPO|nr:hypothetical protein H0G86_005456 [Trichoderma simmonsii]